MASQGVVEKTDHAGSLKPPTSEEGGMESKEVGLLDSRPLTAVTTIAHDEEKGEDPPSDEKAPPNSVFIIPDGGYRAWSVVVGGAFVLFSTFGYVCTWIPHIHNVPL
jgi:hypothetical protein